MLYRNDSRNNHRDNTNPRDNRKSVHKPAGIDYFYFSLSEKNHEIVLPVETETPWEQLHEITWDPGRGD